ncbi:CLUMA_CG010785, isoform A [Clunio marinus]|uniref:CLUMA_CG010785, isoform A n=1 Tax=Clunio marinus TaxID=568069 RepID=A0A1J1IB07_9DIPT|nr:CLUMA_CG010785, isoform A [Clunio marinus]
MFKFVRKSANFPFQICLMNDIRCLTNLNAHRFASTAAEKGKFSIKDEISDGRPLYLDAQATTPLDPRVLDRMMPFMTNCYGNPHSRTHYYGWETEKAVEDARAQVAHLIGADPKEIIFTSGATESNNIAVKAIYVRRRPRVRIEALQSGGGQERGLRSGTLPAPLVVGLGAACDIASKEMDYDHKWMEFLSQRLIKRIFEELPNVIRNGDPVETYPGCVNLSFAFVEGESLLMALKDVALSSGSACTSASLEPSYVLRAIGTDEDLAHSSIRFGIGRFTTIEEVDYTVDKCIKHVTRLREMSPLWEMVQEGIDIKEINWSQH